MVGEEEGGRDEPLAGTVVADGSVTGVSLVRCADAAETNNNQTITVTDSNPFIPHKLKFDRLPISFSMKNNYQLSIINYQFLNPFTLSPLPFPLTPLATAERAHQISALPSPVHG